MRDHLEDIEMLYFLIIRQARSRFNPLRPSAATRGLACDGNP
jgi:hypothetical protein